MAMQLLVDAPRAGLEPRRNATSVDAQLPLAMWSAATVSKIVAGREPTSLFHRLAEAIPEPMVITRVGESTRSIVYANPAFYRFSGCSAAQVLGRDWRSLLDSGLGVLRAGYARTVARRDGGREALRVQDELGNERCLDMRSWALRDETGAVTHQVTLLRDVTAEQINRDGLERRAYHDALTGLANRYLFYDRFHQAVAHARRHCGSFVIALLDMDNFKTINDRFGHQGGDQVLKCFGARVAAAVRAEDTVARLGGDEFVLLLDEADGGEPMHRVIARIREAIGRPMILDGKQILLSCCVGISRYPADGEDLDHLLRVADSKLYRVKASRHVDDERIPRPITGRPTAHETRTARARSPRRP